MYDGLNVLFKRSHKNYVTPETGDLCWNIRGGPSFAVGGAASYVGTISSHKIGELSLPQILWLLATKHG
jgi:hypothetical protein